MGAFLHLFHGFRLNELQISRLQGLGQFFSARGVDALSNNHERARWPYDDGFFCTAHRRFYYLCRLPQAVKRSGFSFSGRKARNFAVFSRGLTCDLYVFIRGAVC